MKFGELKNDFLFSKRFINLNNAGICPPPKSSVDYVNNYHKRYCENGLNALIEEFPGEDKKVRKGIADLIGAASSNIAITHNTSEGINQIAQGYPFNPGDVILTLEKEYPANVYPWLNLKNKGVHLKFLPEKYGKERLDNIKNAIDKNVKMLTVSFVEWCSGYKNDIYAIGEICKNEGIPLIVDGAQGIGALELDVKNSGISAISGSCWKWLWGPLGLGFLYINDDLLEKISQAFVGAESVAGWDNLLDYKLEARKGAQRFEYATKNYSDIVQFSKCIELTNNLGIKNIEKKLIEITEMFRDAVIESGGKIFGNFGKNEQSGIFSFTINNKNPEELKKELHNNNILTNVRDGKLRIAPHVYLDKDDVENFKNVLKKII